MSQKDHDAASETVGSLEKEVGEMCHGVANCDVGASCDFFPASLRSLSRFFSNEREPSKVFRRAAVIEFTVSLTKNNIIPLWMDTWQNSCGSFHCHCTLLLHQ